MIICNCTHKFRDKNNRIYGYRLKDTYGHTQEVTSESLKKAILKGQVSVSNLTLTSNNRLIDSYKSY